MVHVLTEVTDDDPGYGFSDVTLARYNGGVFDEHIPITGSTCESVVARCMHEHWCDLQRLIRCVQGDTDTLSLLDIDWELGPSTQLLDEPAPSDAGGRTSRVLALIQRAESRCVRVPEPDEPPPATDNADQQLGTAVAEGFEPPDGVSRLSLSRRVH